MDKIIFGSYLNECGETMFISNLDDHHEHYRDTFEIFFMTYTGCGLTEDTYIMILDMMKTIFPNHRWSCNIRYKNLEEIENGHVQILGANDCTDQWCLVYEIKEMNVKTFTLFKVE